MGIAYSASKAAFGRVAGGLNAEFGPAVFRRSTSIPATSSPSGARPSPVRRVRAGLRRESPEATAAAAAWLATSDEAADLLGKWIFGPRLTADRHLLGD